MNTRLTELADALGPRRVVWLRDPRLRLQGYVVVDNVAAGPAFGGVRMAPNLDVVEVARLARAMTLKNAAAGLAHGGAKAGIVGDPAMPAAEKEAVIRGFGRLLAELTDYVPGPDMGTDETCMAWLTDEMGRPAVGLPRVLGGIPLDEIGATGWGLAAAAEVAVAFIDLALAGARVAVQGFGAVGRWAARYLVDRGAVLVAASDSRGGVVRPDGLDLDLLLAHKDSGASVATFPGGTPIDDTSLIDVACDVWIPAARPDVLTDATAPRLQARLVLQGANIPATPDAERVLAERGVLSVPDFIANAGGVLCAAVEYRGGTQARAMETIRERVGANTREVLERARRDNLLPRTAAENLARERVEEAMRYRRAR